MAGIVAQLTVCQVDLAANVSAGGGMGLEVEIPITKLAYHVRKVLGASGLRAGRRPVRIIPDAGNDSVGDVHIHLGVVADGIKWTGSDGTWGAEDVERMGPVCACGATVDVKGCQVVVGGGSGIGGNVKAGQLDPVVQRASILIKVQLGSTGSTVVRRRYHLGAAKEGLKLLPAQLKVAQLRGHVDLAPDGALCTELITPACVYLQIQAARAQLVAHVCQLPAARGIGGQRARVNIPPYPVDLQVIQVNLHLRIVFCRGAEDVERVVSVGRGVSHVDVDLGNGFCRTVACGLVQQQWVRGVCKPYFILQSLLVFTPKKACSGVDAGTV